MPSSDWSRFSMTAAGTLSIDELLDADLAQHHRGEARRAIGGLRDPVEDQIAAVEAGRPGVVERQSDEARAGIDNQPDRRAVDRGGHPEVAAPVGAIDQGAAGRRPEHGRQLGAEHSMAYCSAGGRYRRRVRRRWVWQGRRGAQVPIYPAVYLPVGVFDLAQLAVVGDDYAGLAFFIGDLPGRRCIWSVLAARRRRAARPEAAQQIAKAGRFMTWPFSPGPRSLIITKAYAAAHAIVSPDVTGPPAIEIKNMAQIKLKVIREPTAPPPMDRRRPGPDRFLPGRGDTDYVCGSLRVRHCRRHRIGPAPSPRSRLTALAAAPSTGGLPS